MSSVHVLKRTRQLLGMIYSTAVTEEVFARLMNLAKVYGSNEEIMVAQVMKYVSSQSKCFPEFLREDRTVSG